MKQLLLIGTFGVVLVGAGAWSSLSGWLWNAADMELTAMPSGRHFYVSPTGTAQGDGSLASPWDLQTAFNHPPSIVAGDVVELLEGTYQTADGSHFFCRLQGKDRKYILIRPRGTDHVRIAGGIEVDGPWVIIRDLEVASNNPDRTSDQETSFPTDVGQLVGFNVFASNVKILNNFIHDNSAGVDGWAQAPDTEYYGNLVYYNGWQTAAKKAHGHGFYMQNTSGTKWLRDNIIFNQFAAGVQIYGSDKADLNNFQLVGNIIFNNGSLNGEHNRNLLIGGGKVAHNPVVTENYMYFPPEMTLGGDHNLGYDPFGSGCSDLKFTRNYIASDGPALTLFKCSVDDFKGNTLYGELKGFKREDYPGNEYFDKTSPARGVHVFVRPNRYEPGRANIAVFNWDRKDSIEVDLSKIGLGAGDPYEIHSAQDYFRDIQTGTFDEKPVHVSMTGRTIAEPAGVPAPPSTYPEFGAFVVRKAAGTASATASK